MTKEFKNDASFDNGFSWVDITNDFFDAISCAYHSDIFHSYTAERSNDCFYFSVLRLGELFHDELFGLFEAMSAIEMMDPKMDAGMLCNRGGKPTLNFEQALLVIF